MIVSVPFTGSESTMVSGMRSPFSSIMRMTNWPALRFLAISGASKTVLTMFSERTTFSVIRCNVSTLLFLQEQGPAFEPLTAGKTRSGS